MRRRWMRPRSSLTGSGYKIDLGPPIFAAFCASWSLAEHERGLLARGVPGPLVAGLGLAPGHTGLPP